MEPTDAEVVGMTDALSSLANSLSQNKDPRSNAFQRSRLVLQAKQMINQIQNPIERISDEIVQISTIGAASALIDMGVFDAVPATGSIGVKALAEKCKADEELIIRLMRQLTCVGLFTETGHAEWAHNRQSLIRSEHAGALGKLMFIVAFDEMGPPMLAFYRFIREFGAKDVQSYTQTPHSWYNNMLGKTFWEVLGTDPQRLNRFNTCLAMYSGSHPVVAIYPYQQLLKHGNSPDRPAIVDVGGGHGQAILQLRQGCPELQGEMVLQDRPDVIAEINPDSLPGITLMAHDFFTEQPIKNAQVYYIRRVMHDWLDPEATKILEALKPAMAPDSRILISDMALPDPAHLQDAGAVWLDLMVMTIGGKERTHGDWQKLADLAGLKLNKIWQEPAVFGPLCVVEYVLKDNTTAPTTYTPEPVGATDAANGANA